MANIVNLNKARKQKQRKDAETLAAANRLKFGRSKAQKQLDAAEADAARQRLDGLHREPPTEG